MSDHDKVVEYELQIEDMLHALQDRLDEFEKGRQLAYTEMMEIIKTRHQMIIEVLSEE